MTLFVTDLDGTLLDMNAKLKPRSAEMLNRFIKDGVLFSYATARSLNSSHRIMSEVNINIPVIVMNGAIIVDFNSGEKLVFNKFSERAINTIREYAEKNNEALFVHSYIDGIEHISYLKNNTKPIKSFLTSHKNDERMRQCDNYDELFDGEVYYSTFINFKGTSEDMDSLFFEKNGLNRSLQKDTYLDEMWYEIFSENGTKANAVKKLKEITGADNVVAFGDNLSDISMIKTADTGVAVSNANVYTKEAADIVIKSNENQSVPQFIESSYCKKFDYYENELYVHPDQVRFKLSLEKALEREISTIGTLNEKTTHNALKCYFSHDIDQEAKIGRFYADCINENGIYEIQTANFGKLNDKLEQFLQASHVTVVYPYIKAEKKRYFNKNTGELIKETKTARHYDLTTMMIEFYRIKSFLTNPNLTICIADMEIEVNRYVNDERCIKRRGQRVDKIPKRFLKATYLENPESYRCFLPDNLPDEFTEKQLEGYKIHCQAHILLEILGYMGIVERTGKSGNAFTYKIVK